MIKQIKNANMVPTETYSPLQYLASVLGLSCQKEAYTILQDFQANLSLNSSC